MPSWSPYNYAFNNPIKFIDPDGMAPVNPIKNYINKTKEKVINKVTYTAKLGALHAAGIAYTEAKNYVNNKLDDLRESMSIDIDFKMGGYMLANGKGGRSGDHKLIRKATKDDSSALDMVNAEGIMQLGNFGKPGSPNSKSSWLGEVLDGTQKELDAIGHYDNISTAINDNKDVIVTKSVKVVSYTFHLIDSTVTTNTQTATFKGEASTVKRQVDSVQWRNEIRASSKEDWLKSWGK